MGLLPADGLRTTVADGAHVPVGGEAGRGAGVWRSKAGAVPVKGHLIVSGGARSCIVPTLRTTY